MNDTQKDLCPMCKGEGHMQHPLSPPNGEYYFRVRVSFDEDDYSHTIEAQYESCKKQINELASKGYELHSFQEDERGTTWMMQWRWR